MAKDRTDRPQSWEAVVEDIQEALSHQNQRTRRLRRGEQAGQTHARRTHQPTPESRPDRVSANGDQTGSTSPAVLSPGAPHRSRWPSVLFLALTACLLGLALAVLIGVLLGARH